MILNYRGSHDNWTLEEADVISHCVVSIKDVREIIKRSEKYQCAKDADHAHKILFGCICDFIREETDCAEEMTWHGLIDINDGNNFIVVTLDKTRTRVFSLGSGVYILNASGKTVQKL